MDLCDETDSFKSDICPEVKYLITYRLDLKCFVDGRMWTYLILWLAFHHLSDFIYGSYE